MFNKTQVFQGDNPDVWKHVFEKDDAICEAVLYRYDSFDRRTVICCSVQSGCPVGCVFCGTGKKFVRDLTADEIVYQITHVLKEHDIEDSNSRCAKFQIMFMSMGEPMLNWDAVEEAIELLHRRYPNADLLVSTVGIADRKVFQRMVDLGMRVKKMGLQFSLHDAFDPTRNVKIPHTSVMGLRQLRSMGTFWAYQTGRQVYLNFCPDKKYTAYEHQLQIERLQDLFDLVPFAFTFSVVCETEEGKPHAQDLELVKHYETKFLEEGYNTRIFNPAGQDDIGGGCGQLWYVQEWMRRNSA